METSRLLYQNQNGIWRCPVCKKTSDTLREAFLFHCFTCSDFDICRNCYEPKRHPIHNHELKVVDTSLIYAHTGGSWVCGMCGNSSRPCEVLSHHCGECGFDVCQDCFKPHSTPLHEHALYKADPRHVYAQLNGGWRCYRCWSVYNNPVDNQLWHCQTCEFDLCHACMSPTVEDHDAPQAPPDVDMEEISDPDVPGPSMDPNSMLPPLHVGIQGPRRYVDPDEECRRLKLRIREMEMENICIICEERPRNSFLLHGDGVTSHRCCCDQCGKRLQSCPICRKTIARVVLCHG